MEAKQGQKIPEGELSKLDPAKMGPSLVKKPEAEVEAQALVYTTRICPYCFNTVWIWYDTNRYHCYTCCYCGGVFTA